ALLMVWVVLVVVRRRQRQAEEAEARLRGILDSAPDSIVILDRDGRIALLNAQTEQMFGHQRAALLGRPVEALVPDRLPDMFRACLDQAGAVPVPVPVSVSVPVLAPEAVGLELVGRHRDGTEVFVEARLAVITTAGRTVVTCILRDVGERKRAEEALR